MVQAMGAVQYTIALVSLALVVWGYQPWLTALVFALMLPAALRMWINARQIYTQKALSPKYREARGMQQYFTQRQSAKEMRIMHAEVFFMEAWEKSMQDIMSQERSISLVSTRLRFGADIIDLVITIGAYGLCIYYAMSGHIEVGTFGALVVLIGQMMQSSTAFMRSMESMHQYVVSLASAMEYFKLPSERRLAELGFTPKVLQFEDVSFCYPGSSRKAVANLNITLRAGETLAVVGVNGSGKTTFSKLALGLLDPTEGSVTIDGILSSTLAHASLYGRESAVFQNHVHYAMKLKDNILLSSPGAALSDDDVLSYLYDMGITFVHDNPELSPDSELGAEYGGRDLSGGEWQQLAIARAAWRPSDIMVLDEPSSAMDPLRESAMYATFQNLCQDRIGVIITHRLGLCAYADRIMVMDAGHMLEYGTHAELLQHKGKYAEMYWAQQDLHTSRVP